MSHRAAIILIKDASIALIERHRDGQHYFTFPGGHVEANETPQQAAMRETMEELGLKVALQKLVVTMQWNGHVQYYFLAEITGGSFGSGTGEEILSPAPGKGTYSPIWVPLSKLMDPDVRPREVAELVTRCLDDGWPEETIFIPE